MTCRSRTQQAEFEARRFGEQRSAQNRCAVASRLKIRRADFTTSRARNASNPRPRLAHRGPDRRRNTRRVLESRRARSAVVRCGREPPHAADQMDLFARAGRSAGMRRPPRRSMPRWTSRGVRQPRRAAAVAPAGARGAENPTKICPKRPH